jgi:catechol 2,3-dioxygenase-like lactoylglutathione lyase family enzyme
MSVELNHTIVWSRDKEISATFLADILGLPAPKAWGPFFVVEVANGVTLDYHDVDGEFGEQHFAFLISEEEFDDVFARITERDLDYWADPFKHQPRAINHNDGGRGMYFPDPDGHLMEVITRPYGSG